MNSGNAKAVLTTHAMPILSEATQECVERATTNADYPNTAYTVDSTRQEWIMKQHERAPTSDDERRKYKTEWQRQWRENNPEEYRKQCKAYEKSEKRKQYKAEWQRKWREKNREEAREISRKASAKHREANREQTIAATRRWQENNPEHVLETSRAWVANNPEKVAKYRKDHAAARAAHDIARKTAQRKATPQWADVSEMQKFYAERDRLTQETGVQHHVDHIVPIRGDMVSGQHNQFNLRVVTAEENLRKGNKLVDDIV